MLAEITIVIAAYNEEARLPASLVKIQAYLTGKELKAEIVVVDDGSTDSTAHIVRGMARGVPGLRVISYPHNRGKGHALRQGVISSRGRLVLLTDADLSTPIQELENLMRPLFRQTHQIAIGSRALPESDVATPQPTWRRGMGRMFNRMVRLLVIKGLSDTQCGFKLFDGEVARKLFAEARVDRFATDVEILALARRYGFRIAEVPVTWRDCRASKVNPALDSLQMLADLLRIRAAVRRPPVPLQDLEQFDELSPESPAP